MNSLVFIADEFVCEKIKNQLQTIRVFDVLLYCLHAFIKLLQQMVSSKAGLADCIREFIRCLFGFILMYCIKQVSEYY